MTKEKRNLPKLILQQYMYPNTTHFYQTHAFNELENRCYYCMLISQDKSDHKYLATTGNYECIVWAYFLYQTISILCTCLSYNGLCPQKYHLYQKNNESTDILCFHLALWPSHICNEKKVLVSCQFVSNGTKSHWDGTKWWWNQCFNRHMHFL